MYNQAFSNFVVVFATVLQIFNIGLKRTAFENSSFTSTTSPLSEEWTWYVNCGPLDFIELFHFIERLFDFFNIFFFLGVFKHLGLFACFFGFFMLDNTLRYACRFRASRVL